MERTVKYPDSEDATPRARIRRLCILLAGILGAAVTTVPPANADLGPLFGGGLAPAKAPPPLDPDLPQGAIASTWVGRPVAPEPGGCSFRFPVCVHRGETHQKEALAWLAALEDAYARLVLALGAPRPLPDREGGGPELDLYLSEGADSVAVHPAEPAPWRDESAAWCATGAAERPRLRAASLCVAESIAWALDAAETPATKRALAEHLWLATGEPSSADAAAFDNVQRYPERSLVAREVSFLAEGSSLFFDALDALHGAGAPGRLSLALFSLSSGEASPIGWRWRNEPDLLDVLRENFGTSPSAWGRFLGQLAVLRAKLGTRSIERPIPSLAWLGAFGRVRFDWVLPLSSLPRRVAPRAPIEPLGMTYLWVPLDEPTDTLTLAFAAEWEGPVAFKWMLVTVGADGREITRVDVPYLERQTRVERTLVRFDDAVGVMIVGTNLGDLSPTYPFDPDFAPYEPHGYTVHLAKL